MRLEKNINIGNPAFSGLDYKYQRRYQTMASSTSKDGTLTHAPQKPGGKGFHADSMRTPTPVCFEPQLEDAFSALKREVSDFAKSRETHESKMRALLSSLSAKDINNMLYRIFAPYYDEFMSGHEIAIGRLVRQMSAVEQVAFQGEGPLGHIFRDPLLEMSCGTGTVVKLICDSMPEERLALLKVTANDLSDDMKARAYEKLSGYPCSLGFSSTDLYAADFPKNSFGTAVLSQTLHLMSDQDVVAEERSGNYVHMAEDRHMPVKFNLIRKAFDCMKEDGTFLIIDEWPAILSNSGGELGPGFAYLFNDGLRPIDRSALKHYMNTMPDVHFIAQLSVPIDSRHSMYVLAYRKHSGKVPRSQSHAKASDRRIAVSRVVESFIAAEKWFIEAIGTRGAKPLPMADAKPHISRRKDPIDIRGPSDCIVLSMRMHHLDHETRLALISSSIESLRLGGSLLIIDEWPPPGNARHKVRLDELKRSCVTHFSAKLMRAGSLRIPIDPHSESGMHGYRYVKISD